MHNRRRMVKRIIEPGTRTYNWGVFETQNFGPRVMTQVLEGGTYQDAVALLEGDRTVGGHSIRGFRKLKKSNV